MSGEYFCIEEVDPGVFYNEKPMGEIHFANRDNDAQSTSSKKSQDLRLHEIEEQLEVAENRCNTLKGQLDCMKKIYHKTGKSEPASHHKTSVSLHNEDIDNSFLPKNARKRACSPPIRLSRSRSCLPSKKGPIPDDIIESTETITPKSSSSSTAVEKELQQLSSPHKETYSITPLIRQNSSYVGTDNTGAAVVTINNILTGITDSVNRLSQLHAQEKEHKKSRKRFRDSFCGTTDNSAVFTVPTKPFSPRVEKRIVEQQKRVEEIARNMEPMQDPLQPVDWRNQEKTSITSLKNKQPHGTWVRHTNVKMAPPKTKIQYSSGSVNLAKNLKSTAKHVENTTKINPVKTNMSVEESSSVLISRKRRRSIKRLKPASKMSLGRKISDHGKHFDQFTTDNLVELYHNVAAKESDSDDSNNAHKSTRQKGGGDLPVSAVHIVPECNNEETLQYKPVNRVFQSSRILAPINEHGFAEIESALPKSFSTITKNYELPTIASKMKQATKCYLERWNFRSIPFCAAKSTTPSHNIGINIQQVMSIIKTRQPIHGISATLAHNISLAAVRLQSRPLSALVSTLSSKIKYGRSQCPLVRNPLNYSQLQEMAKEIHDEAYSEQQLCCSVEVSNEVAENLASRASGDREELNEPTVWSVDPTNQQRCTCAFQNGVPFQQVLSKYQMSSDATCIDPKQAQITKISRLAPYKSNKATFNSGVRKQRTKNWIRNDSRTTPAVNKPLEKNTLQSKERNLKTVLRNLHDEFDSLNSKYEELAKKISKNDVETIEEATKELEDMEKSLNKKEEEINMVMSLYTEVLALKEQVKRLRERTSQSSITVPRNSTKPAEYKEPKAALHLTQLLRQIQNYQTRCKNNI